MDGPAARILGWMMTELKYPCWQEPVQAALLEFNLRELDGKIRKAEEAIGSRMSKLGFENREEESRLLHDSLSIFLQC